MRGEPTDWDLRGDKLAAEVIARGEPTRWFDRLYAEGVAGDITMPWDRADPHVLLREWAERARLDGTGKRAVVVGCGLGADAAYLASLGFATVGFDVAPTAIEVARARHGDAGVEFRVADLVALPEEWTGAFDLVVEIFTIQALPDPPRAEAARRVTSLVAPGGSLLAVAFRHDGSTSPEKGPPFALTQQTMDGLAVDGLSVVAREELPGPRWRVEYHRDARPSTGGVDFYSAYAQGFARVAACTVPVAIADPAVNAATVLEQARVCHDEGVAVALFPELALSGYAIDDLLMQDTLLAGVEQAVADLVEGSADLLPVLVVGAPLVHGTRVVNAAVVIHRGVLLGVAVKSYLPTYREFYERRWFSPGDDRRGSTIRVAGYDVPLGPDLIFDATDVPGLRLHVEICEDMWVPIPPSAEASPAGATVLSNLPGSPITVARAEERRLLVRSASARCSAAYLYAAAGQGESTTDLSWDGQTLVYECGDLLAESDRFPETAQRAVADVDLDRIRQERIRQGT
ncbi:MAG: nitrilase-related carbon-nitrogen hydrolase, partial [Nocardioides sp.]